MASKKGIGLTIVILIAITTASFLIWLIPQTNQTSFVISDFENKLDNVKEIHETLEIGIDEEFQKMLNGETSAEEYIRIAEISSSQINSEIIQLVESKPSEEWQESYLNYLESLRKFNSYIRETIVVANLKVSNGDNGQIQQILENLNDLKEESKSFTQASDDSRP